MQKRAEDVDRTRRRITEAAVELHTTIGPANTTISALADHAGVTRLTVYKHFPDEEQLFGACSRHWFGLHPPPNVALWREIADPRQRAERAIADMYAWYGENGSDLFPLQRDRATWSAPNRKAALAVEAQRVDAVIDGTELRGRDRKRMRAVVGHVLDFWTWHSLVVRRELSSKEAIDVAAGFVTALLRSGTAKVRR